MGCAQSPQVTHPESPELVSSHFSVSPWLGEVLSLSDGHQGCDHSYRPAVPIGFALSTGHRNSPEKDLFWDLDMGLLGSGMTLGSLTHSGELPSPC